MKNTLFLARNRAFFGLFLCVSLLCEFSFAQVNVTPVPFVKAQYFNGSVPCNGCKLYTYAAGTTTPLLTYTDSTGSTLNSDPVVLDSNGYGSIWLGPSVYKLVLKTSAGATIWTVDGVRDKNLESVCYADQQSGADIGAKINACVTALGAQGGTITVPTGGYSFSTKIVKPRNVLLLGQGAQSTVLNYTGSSTALVIGNTAASAPTGFTTSEYGAQDFSLIGPSGAGSTIGIYLGGDPAAVISPTNYFANGVNFLRVQVEAFGVGVQWGNNAYHNNFFSSTIKGNGKNLYLPSTTTNSGENISFFGSFITNSVGVAVQQDMSNSDLNFFGTSFDFNNDTLGPDFSGTSLFAECFGCHLEKTSSSFLDISSGTFKMFGGIALLDSGTGTDAYMFHMSGAGGSLTLDSVIGNSGHTVTQWVKWDASGLHQLHILKPQLSGITATINAGYSVNSKTYVEDPIAGTFVRGTGGSFGVNAATTGFFNMPNANFINFRNATNSGDVAAIGVNNSNQVVIDFAGNGATTGGTLGLGGAITAPLVKTTTNCAGVGTAASPSVASCSAAPAGAFSCATNATGATCQVNTSAVTANSQIFVWEDETLGARLGVTCNTSTTVIPTSRLLASRSAGVSFTINLGTVTTNPACFGYLITN